MVNSYANNVSYVNISLQDFAREVSNATNKNIFIDEDLTKENISFYIPTLKNPKELFDAFKLAIEKKNLVLSKKGNFYYLSKKKEFKVKPYLFKLKNNCSEDFEKYLKAFDLKYTYFPSNNSFLVFCNVFQRLEIMSFLSTLDVQAKQVMLKFYIISYDDFDNNERGITLSNSYKTLDGSVRYAINSIIFPLSTTKSILDGATFYSALHFLNANRKIKVRQFPYIFAQNNKNFKFFSVQNIPYLVKSTKVDSVNTSEQNSYEYRDVGLKIVGFPKIFDNFITLNLDLTIEDLINSNGAIPTTNKRYLNSVTNLKYGQVLLLSGIRQKKVQDKTIKIPILSGIPLGIGNMFKYDFTTENSSNIAIAIEVIKNTDNLDFNLSSVNPK